MRQVLYDADSGRLIWRRKIEELAEESVVRAIVSSDPLVMVTSDRGHQLTWRMDPETGERLTPMGPQFLDYRSPATSSLGVHDGAVVVGFSDSLGGVATGFAAYDVATGDERWGAFPKFGTLTGIDANDSLLVATDYLVQPGVDVLTRHNFDDITDYEVLGTMSARTFGHYAVIGDLLIAGDNLGMSGFELPPPGEGQDIEVDVLTDPRQASVDALTWEEGDIRPDDITSCHPSRSTLQAMGFHQLDLPPMAGCEWFERQEPSGVRRSLEVNYQIARPSDAPEQSTAVEAARELMRTATADQPYDAGPVAPGKFLPLPGVGDEAYVSTVTGPGLYAETHLIVRIANLVVHVSATGETTSVNGRGVLTAGYVLEDAVLAAAEDIVAQAGLTLGPIPTPVQGGRIAAPKPICAALDATVGNYVTEGARLEQRAIVDPDGLTSGCYWGLGDESIVIDNGVREYHEYAQVATYAVPGSRLLDRTGVDLAKAAITQLGSGKNHIYYAKPQPIKGLGDQALLFPARANYHEGSVVVRLDNLLVEVRVGDQASDDMARLDRGAMEMARAVVAEYQ